MTEKPTAIRLRKQSRVLELDYADGESYALSWEFLRVHSPSAEVRGHHPSQAVLQHGKKDVEISAVKPVGHYALQLVFNDGHDTGLYGWDYLRELCLQEEVLWTKYLDELHRQGKTRDPNAQVLMFDPK